MATAKKKTTTPTHKEVTKKKKEDLTPLESAVAMYQNFEPETSKSQMIREMHAAGHSKADIAKAMDVRYQHVRNVLITPLKRPVADKLVK